jgi:hypothetical protein
MLTELLVEGAIVNKSDPIFLKATRYVVQVVLNTFVIVENCSKDSDLSCVGAKDFIFR